MKIVIMKSVAWMKSASQKKIVKKIIATKTTTAIMMNVARMEDVILKKIVMKNVKMTLTVPMMTAVLNMVGAIHLTPAIDQKTATLLMIVPKIIVVQSMDIVEQIPSFAMTCSLAKRTLTVSEKSAVPASGIVALELNTVMM